MKPEAWQQTWLRDTAHRIDAPWVWRGVETQYASATTLLVDTGDEQDLLESMLEGSKPPLPAMAIKHYLLATPFRYTPKRDSRFRPAGHHGLWYGAIELRAACAEVAYWRMVFILDSTGLRDAKIVTQHTLFSAHVAGTGIDLTAPPWAAARDAWTNGQDYAETHRLASATEAAGIEVIQYESVRSPGDTNLAVFTPEALSEPDGGVDASREAWICSATRDRVLMQRVGAPAQKFEWTR
ncbi:MAG: RES family NAD+ phosphorylase [Xanthomonadaceae bacterium]|nr:RES family NAD+ phosphorylase [Xanthomonadaceae bacterium]